MWMVRAESDSSLFQPFISHGVVAIGWAEVGDLQAFSSREEILSMVRQQYPDWKKGAHITSASMLHRFSKEIEPEDAIITYDRTRRVYAVGSIKERYRFDPRFNADYPNVRDVEWTATEVSRDGLATATRNTLGSTLTLFRIPEPAEQDILRVTQGRGEVPPPDELIEEEEELLHDLQSRSLEFIKDRLVQLDWGDMQKLVAGLLRAMGYKTRISAVGPDRGKDIVASPDGFGFESPRIVAEVKHRPNSSMGSQEIRSFVGGRHPEDKGLYVSTGGFTQDARYEAERAKVPVTLMGLDELVEALVDYYEHMDAETRRLVPLRRVYWPVG